MSIKTLVIAPHPDDEVMGGGGLLLRRRFEQVPLAWLIVTGMNSSDGFSSELVKKRSSEIEEVAASIGFKEVYELNFPAARLDEIPMRDLVGSISEVFQSFSPTEILLPHRGDVHSDHRVVFDAVTACTKWFRYPTVRRVLAYETVSETEFGLSKDQAFFPNYFVDISLYLDEKLRLMQIYQSEIGSPPFPRSIEVVKALATFRGATAGYNAAEAFELLRENT